MRFCCYFEFIIKNINDERRAFAVYAHWRGLPARCHRMEMMDKAMKFLTCVLYLAVIGILSYFMGEALPRSWFDSAEPPFHVNSWERGGAFYERLHIRKWKDKLPDMSRIMPKMLPKRLMHVRLSAGSRVERLIQETCVAEAVHLALMVMGAGCLLIWPEPGGLLVSLLWAAGNLPFVAIQRYNRPRLKKLAQRAVAAVRKAREAQEEYDLELRYGRGT